MSILKLKVTSYHRLTPGQVVEQVFTEQGGSIGRSAKSNWVLPDPDKVISSVHAYVSYQSGQFYITDNSTNGLFVNRSVQPLGKGNSQSLADGDYLQLGDYEVEVAVEAGSAETLSERPSQTPPPVEPARQPEGGLAQTSAEPQQHTQTHSEALSQDPYAENFSPPMAQIPEDWDNQQGAKPAEPVQDQSIPPQPQVDPMLPVPPQVERQPHHQAAPGQQAAAPVEQQQHDQGYSQQPTAMPQHAHQSQLSQQQPTAPQAPAAPAPNVVGNASFDSIDDSQAKAYLTSFLNAAGLREDDLPREVSPALFEAMGGALRFSLQGMLDILRARSDMKSEFRVMQTTIRTQENNPLKFSINVDEAMRNLFLRQVPGFLPWFQAIESCFKDMSSHELALMAGTQGAVQGVLDTLDPDDITRANQSDSALHKVLPATKKAKLWDVFVALHKEAQDEVGQGSEKTFSEDFAAAYEAQLKKLGAN